MRFSRSAKRQTKGENNMKTISLKDDTVITEDNIQNLGEAIALKALKGSLRYAYGHLDYLYQEMINELYRRNTTDNYSDAYDIVQETVFFLCNYLGHKLGELCGEMTIRLTCFKKFMRLSVNKLRSTTTKWTTNYCYIYPRKKRQIRNQPITQRPKQLSKLLLKMHWKNRFCLTIILVLSPKTSLYS